MRTVHAAAGVVCRDGAVLVVRRASNDDAGLWEFPQVTLAPHEAAAAACERGLRDGLRATVCGLRSCYTIEHDFEDHHLSVECFQCHLAKDSAEPATVESQHELAWVRRAELVDLQWAPAAAEFASAVAHAESDDLDSLAKRRRDSRSSMKGNTRANTKPELLVRQRLRAAGLTGYRLQWKKAPGRPDIAFPGRRIAIFVNGCFWHRCPHCNPSVPKRNREFWEGKFARNVERDRAALEELDALGWTAITIWECQLKRDRVDETMERVIEQVRAAGGSHQPQK